MIAVEASPGFVGEGAIDSDDIALGQKLIQVRLELCSQLFRVRLAVAPVVE
jgi:hypothetical protein